MVAAFFYLQPTLTINICIKFYWNWITSEKHDLIRVNLPNVVPKIFIFSIFNSLYRFWSLKSVWSLSVLTFHVPMFVAVLPSGMHSRCLTENRIVLILVYTLWLIDKHNTGLLSRVFSQDIPSHQLPDPARTQY